jgi:hypothetical protein
MTKALNPSTLAESSRSCAFISRSPESFRLGGDILVYPWQEVLGI